MDPTGLAFINGEGARRQPSPGQNLQNASVTLPDLFPLGYSTAHWCVATLTAAEGGPDDTGEADEELEEALDQFLADEAAETSRSNSAPSPGSDNTPVDTSQYKPANAAGTTGTNTGGTNTGEGTSAQVDQPSQGAQAAENAGADANKLNHIFGNAQHGLDGVVNSLGSQQAAMNALQQATEVAVQQQGLTGVFETTVQVAGETVTVRGNVVNGVVKIGTAFK